jgi:hypothetical protein
MCHFSEACRSKTPVLGRKSEKIHRPFRNWDFALYFCITLQQIFDHDNASPERYCHQSMVRRIATSKCHEISGTQTGYHQEGFCHKIVPFPPGFSSPNPEPEIFARSGG